MAVAGEFSGLRRAADSITSSLVALHQEQISGNSNLFEAPAVSDDEAEDVRIDSKSNPSSETKVSHSLRLLEFGKIRTAMLDY